MPLARYTDTNSVTLTSLKRGDVTRHRFNWRSVSTDAIKVLNPPLAGFVVAITVANTDSAAATSNSLYLYDEHGTELTSLWPLTGVAVNSAYYQMMHAIDAFYVPLSLLPYLDISVFRIESTTSATFGIVDVYMRDTP